MIGYAAQDYARSVMHPGHPAEQMHGDDHDTVVEKLSEDLAGQVTEGEILQKMSAFQRQAERLRRSGTPD